MLLPALLLFAPPLAQDVPTHWRLRVLHEAEDGAQPVPGALVLPSWELGSLGAPLAEVRTDERGEAAIDLAPVAALAPEERPELLLRAIVSAPGFRAGETLNFLEHFELYAGAEELALVPGHAIVGRIVDHDGRPVFDADVRLCWRATDGGGWHEESSTSTDHAGAFVLEACEHDTEARHFLAANHGAYGAALVELGESEPLLTLAARVAPVRGVVVGPRGRPLPGKLVLAAPVGDTASAFERYCRVLSDEHGCFELHLPEEGTWAFEAEGVQPCEISPAAVFAEPGAESLVVRACKPHALVHVEDARGRPLRGIVPRLQRMRSTPAGPRAAYARARSPIMGDGSSLLGKLPGDGRYLIELHDPGLYGLKAGVRLGAFEVADEALLQVDPETDLAEATLVLRERPLAPPLALDVRDARARPTRDWSATLLSPETGLVVSRLTPAGVPITSTCGDMEPAEPRFPVGRYILRVDPEGHALPIEQEIELRFSVPGAAPPVHELASPGFGARLRVERTHPGAALPRGLSLHLHRGSDAHASGPWRLYRERAGSVDLWCPAEHESWPVHSLLLPPGTWTLELRDGDAVRSRGVLELSAGQSAVLELEA